MKSLLNRFSALALLVGAASYGCASDPHTFVDTSKGGTNGDAGTPGTSGSDPGVGGADGMGGTNAQAGSGANGGSVGEGGTSGQAGDGSGGEGGEPPEPPPASGRPGQTIVAGGRKMSSANYVLWTATGEAPGGNRVFISSKYRMVGGVIGTTQPE